MSDNELREHLVQLAYAVQLAAITNRDLVDAMPRAAYGSMPGDIRRRLETPLYQGVFDALPEDVQAEARRLIDTDLDIIEARRIDQANR